MIQSTSGDPVNLLIDSVLSTVAILPVLAMRITRRTYWGFTTEDRVAALSFMAVIPVLVCEFGPAATIMRRLFCLRAPCHAFGYVPVHDGKAGELLSIASVFTLFSTGGASVIARNTKRVLRRV